VLREAGLVRSQRAGVELQNASCCTEIETRFPGLLPAIVGAVKAQSVGRAGSRPGKKAKARL
jgi:hypothetical protein